MTALHEQGALFGEPATVPTQPTAAAGSNDLDLMASVVRIALDPGYVVIGPADKPYRRDPATRGVVEPIPTYEADMIAQLLDAGHLTLGGVHHVRCGRHDGPAHSVLVPKTTRCMVDRWAHLRPLPTPPAARGPAPEPVTVHVDVVAPGRGLVTCGAGDWSGSITRQADRRYWAETEDGHVVAKARSYRDGAERLARHHGHPTATVVIDVERDERP